MCEILLMKYFWLWLISLACIYHSSFGEMALVLLLIMTSVMVLVMVRVFWWLWRSRKLSSWSWCYSIWWWSWLVTWDICALCSACFNALALGLRPLHLESYLTARSGHSKCSKDIGPTYFPQKEICVLNISDSSVPLVPVNDSFCIVTSTRYINLHFARSNHLYSDVFLKNHFSLKIKLWNYYTQKCQIELMLYIVVPEKGTFTYSFCNSLDNTLVWWCIAWLY